MALTTTNGKKKNPLMIDGLAFDGNDTYDIIGGHVRISGPPQGTRTVSNRGSVSLRCYKYISFVIISYTVTTSLYMNTGKCHV
jgi:hypothetical protein